MDLFFNRSKRTSENGVWIDDTEVENCACCGVKFNFLIRKHHCRQCGGVICGDCSTARKFLESSRSGAPKRICDRCNSNEKGYPAGGRGGDEDEDEEEDAGGGGGRGAGGAPAEEGRKGAAQPRLPDIPLDEAVAALTAHPFEGRWQLILTFSAVELPVRIDGAVSYSPAGNYKHFAPSGSSAAASSRGLGSKAAAVHDNGPVKSGSRVRLFSDLEAKGAAYFKGTVPEFGQFGMDGKLTGSIQKATGRVNATIQVVHTATRVTTSFNFVGLMSAGGVLQGNFSGCEISKSAGSVAGIFKMMRASDGDDEGGDAAPAAEPAPRPGSKAAAAKKRPDDDDDDDEEAEEERRKQRKAKAKAKKADSDSD